MAHREQIQYCNSIKNRFPFYFKNKSVLDCGSLDVNGCNKYLFEDCDYIGIDLDKGPNVDVVCRIHEHVGTYDVVISTECLEHDYYWEKSLQNMVKMVKNGGLLLITCATTGRAPHGTHDATPKDSPFTNDYYLNLTEEDFRKVIDVEKFKEYEFTIDKNHCDLMFFAVI